MVMTARAHLLLLVAISASSQASVLPVPPPPVVIRDPFNIFFPKGSAELGPDARRLLQNAANAFSYERNDEGYIWIKGHADEAKTDAANFRLGCLRARAARDHLEPLGIPRDKIDITSGGAKYPITASVGHQYNRRVDLWIEAKRVHRETVRSAHRGRDC